MIDTLGDDWRGQHIRAEFAADGVCTDFLLPRPGHSAATAVVLVRRGSGKRTIVWSPGSAPELSPDEVPWTAIDQAAFLHVNGRHGDACVAACRYAREHGIRVSFDGGAGRYREETRRIVPLSDLCIVAREFATRYTGEEDPGQAGPALLQAGPAVVGITDGLSGSWVFSRDGARFHQRAYPVEVVDTTGCGDCYHGAFLSALSRGLDLPSCASLASAAAALNARTLGGRAGLPTLDEVQAFLAEVARD
jgi:sugar/nucleoside kinase (ribokinase family)